jgi:hypothetical protein
MALSKDQLAFIADLVIAGGKSPHTGGDGMMKAAQAIMLIQAELAALEAAAKEAKSDEEEEAG